MNDDDLPSIRAANIDRAIEQADSERPPAVGSVYAQRVADGIFVVCTRCHFVSTPERMGIHAREFHGITSGVIATLRLGQPDPAS